MVVAAGVREGGGGVYSVPRSRLSTPHDSANRFQPQVARQITAAESLLAHSEAATGRRGESEADVILRVTLLAKREKK